MINLIPNTEKKNMTREFYLRLLVVFFIALGCSLAIATAALSPTFFLSSVKKDLVTVKVENNNREASQASPEAATTALALLKDKLALVAKTEKGRFLISHAVVNQIIKSKLPDIKITEITYTEGEEKVISVRGAAPSRERLLLFRKALEENPFFKNVNLPISNFVKGSNIDFSISLSAT